MPTEKVTLYFPFWANPIRNGLSKRSSFIRIWVMCFYVLLCYYSKGKRVKKMTKIEMGHNQ